MRYLQSLQKPKGIMSWSGGHQVSGFELELDHLVLALYTVCQLEIHRGSYVRGKIYE